MRKFIKTVLGRAGVEIRRIPRQHRWHLDAFDDQRKLLAGRDVRAVVDAGADVGTTVRRYRSIFPNGDVYGFEPYGPSFDELSKAFRDDPRVHPLRLGLADEPGTRSFTVNRDSRTNSLLAVSPRHVETVNSDLMQTCSVIAVEVTSIDIFCASKRIESLDVLKMDIQGGELMALRGATRMLSEQRIRLIYAEMLFAPLYEGQAMAWEIIQYLSRFGYDLAGLYELSRGLTGTRLAWCDAIFTVGGSAN